LAKADGGPSGDADQDGGERISDARAVRPSSRQTKDQEERAVEVFGRLCVDAANHPSNPVTAERDQFVCHDLRPKAKTIFRRCFD
jgi:hypothetical protein